MDDNDELDLYDALMTTRAMRRFTDEPVADADIERCLAAAVQAPSGGNIQPYQFLVVTDSERKSALGDLYRRAFDRYDPAVQQLIPPFADDEARRRHERNWAMSRHLADTIGDVPVMVLVLVPRISMAVSDEDGEMDVGPVHASVYPAVENFILAARSRGLGTCLTTVIRIHEAAARAVCAVPDRFEIAALLPVGHPAGRFGVAPRRPAPTLTSWNTYGERRR
ncbi:MAG: nitroreductase family protein [Actinomycetota bacterium]|nr:nitroreductase family protein [Actinomycetota bacterium]